MSLPTARPGVVRYSRSHSRAQTQQKRLVLLLRESPHIQIDLATDARCGDVRVIELAAANHQPVNRNLWQVSGGIAERGGVV